MRGIHRAAVVAAGTVVFVFVGGAPGITATDPGPPPGQAESSMSGQALRRAADAALAPTRPDGTRVDVRLDRSFPLVGEGSDGDHASDGG